MASLDQICRVANYGPTTEVYNKLHGAEAQIGAYQSTYESILIDLASAVDESDTAQTIKDLVLAVAALPSKEYISQLVGGITVPDDLVRRADITTLAKESSLEPLAKSAELSNIVKTADISQLATKDDVAGVSKKAESISQDLASKAEKGDLSPLATKADLGPLATEQTVLSRASSSEVAGVAKEATLVGVGQKVDSAKLAIDRLPVISEIAAQFVASATNVSDAQNAKYLDKILQWNQNIFANVEGWYAKAEDIVTQNSELNYMVNKVQDVLQQFEEMVDTTRELRQSYSQYLSMLGTTKAMSDRISDLAKMLTAFTDYLKEQLAKDHSLEVVNAASNAANALANVAQTTSEIVPKKKNGFF